MWKPIYQPEPWPQFLKRKDIKGLPIMEARKKYMEEQLLFENYYSNLQTLNTINTVSPSVASAAAAAGGGGGGGPKKSIGPSGARGGGPLPLFFDGVYDLGASSVLTKLIDMRDPTLYMEIYPSQSIYEWKYPYAEVGTNHDYMWNPGWNESTMTAVPSYSSSRFPTIDLWGSNGMPNWSSGSLDLLTTMYKDASGGPGKYYTEYMYDGVPSYMDSFRNNSVDSVRKYYAGMPSTLENPIRIDWGDGNVNDYPAGTYTRELGPWQIEQVSDTSSVWTAEAASSNVYNQTPLDHWYDLEHLVPEEWIPHIPDPVYTPRSYSSDNRYSRFAMEPAITSSNGNFPWGSPWNNWWDWTNTNTNIKVYGDPNPASNPNSYNPAYGGLRRINYLDISNRTSFSSLFWYTLGVDITPLNIAAWDTSNITSMYRMFYNSRFTLGKGIKENNLSNWDTSNVTNFDSMFRAQSTEPDTSQPEIGGWDVSSGTNFSGMFLVNGGARWFNTNHNADLSNWNMGNAQNISMMFYYNGAFQHNTNFNNWNISGSTGYYVFVGTSFNQALTNWVPGSGTNWERWCGDSSISHTNYWATLRAWASSSAVDVDTHSSYYPTNIGKLYTRTYTKRTSAEISEGLGAPDGIPSSYPAILSQGTQHFPQDTEAINYKDFQAWFGNNVRGTGITLISGSINHQAYETLLDKGWIMGNHDILDTGSIASNRLTQLPIKVLVSGSQYIMSSSYWTPISEIQPYDLYDPLYTPTLTYRFDQSDPSNTGHPLKLSETLDGTHGGGVEYTTDVTTVGTPGTSGSYTDVIVSNLNGFEVEHKPKLYAYCENHSGMSEFYLEAYI